MGSNFVPPNLDDLFNEGGFSNYMAQNLTSVGGPLKTSASVTTGTPQFTANSFTVSDILQGNFVGTDPTDSLLLLNKATTQNLSELYTQTPAGNFASLGSGDFVRPVNEVRGDSTGGIEYDPYGDSWDYTGATPNMGTGVGDPPITVPPTVTPSGAIMAPQGRQNQILPDKTIGHRDPPFVAPASAVPGFLWTPTGSNEFSGEPVMATGLTYAAYQLQQALWIQFPLLKGHKNYQVRREGKTKNGASGKWSGHAYGSCLDLMLWWMSATPQKGSYGDSHKAYARQIYLWVIEAARSGKFPQVSYVLYNYRIWHYGDIADREINRAGGTLSHVDHIHISTGNWG